MNEIKIKAVDSGKIKDYRKEVLISIEEYNQYCDACKQLQAYKDKEDKLREWLLSVIKEHETGQYDVETVGLAIKEHKGNIEIILQILNEGDK